MIIQISIKAGIQHADPNAHLIVAATRIRDPHKQAQTNRTDLTWRFQSPGQPFPTAELAKKALGPNKADRRRAISFVHRHNIRKMYFCQTNPNLVQLVFIKKDGRAGPRSIF